MVSRVVFGLVAGLVIQLTSVDAQAAFFDVLDLGANEFQVRLNGAAGDAATTLADADIQFIEVVGATFVSHDQTTSIFQGLAGSPANSIQNPMTFQVAGVDFGASTAFNSTSVLSLGNFTLSGPPTAIQLTPTGIFTAHGGSGDPPILISQSGGESLPEPASALLLGLGLAFVASTRLGAKK